MRKTIEVVYEGGVFKPLEPVELEEGEKTKITISKNRCSFLRNIFVGFDI